MENIKVLVVDDESRMRKLVKDFLTREGYAVLEAGDGMEAMDIFYEDKEIALVILDVMMPKMDGWQVCREIRETSKVPIIMLTARTDTADVVRGLDWMKARIRERIFGVLIAAKKVPFTDPGISLLAGEVRAQLRTAITVGLLTDDPAPVVTQPKASAISAVNRQARKLTPGIEFNARLAGAIHTLDVTGTVTN